MRLFLFVVVVHKTRVLGVRKNECTLRLEKSKKKKEKMEDPSLSATLFKKNKPEMECAINFFFSGQDIAPMDKKKKEKVEEQKKVERQGEEKDEAAKTKKIIHSILLTLQEPNQNRPTLEDVRELFNRLYWLLCKHFNSSSFSTTSTIFGTTSIEWIDFLLTICGTSDAIKSLREVLVESKQPASLKAARFAGFIKKKLIKDDSEVDQQNLYNQSMLFLSFLEQETDKTCASSLSS